MIAGSNGSGKTTILNLVCAALLVDLERLNAINFEQLILTFNGEFSPRLILQKEGRFKFTFAFGNLNVQIENRPSSSSIRSSQAYYLEQLRTLRKALAEKLNFNKISMLSASRIFQSQNIVERVQSAGPSIIVQGNAPSPDPMDERLRILQSRFSQYLADINEKLSDIEKQYLHNVLKLLLESPARENAAPFYADRDAENRLRQTIYALELDRGEGQKAVSEFLSTLELYREQINSISNTADAIRLGRQSAIFDIFSRASEITSRYIADRRDIKRPVDTFLETYNRFLKQELFAKRLITVANELYVTVRYGLKKNYNNFPLPYSRIPIYELSSGEKQLLMLFLETLLQKEEPMLFLIDEPDLSLHVTWQNDLLDAIRKLNPNAQLIIATHSPEVGSWKRESMIALSDCFRSSVVTVHDDTVANLGGSRG